jgi:HEPN domain-containing protein
MISRTDLRRIARARLRDSEVLYHNGCYDGSVYLCGYAIEFALKARICRTLRWPAFPSTSREFQSYVSFRTHNLDVLLSLSGAEEKIRTGYVTEWSYITAWDPEVRYRPIGSVTRIQAGDIIASARTLLGVL